jgi:mannitol-1-phosphate 5-dehydrogenase
VSLCGKKKYVGFGFGAIQSGLLIYEAFESKAFESLTVAEVVPKMVDALRKAGGFYSVNIARPDGIAFHSVGPVHVEDPAVEADRLRLVHALAEADEIGTAVPSVSFYKTDRPDSMHRILAEGLREKVRQGGPRAVVYAAENHNHAAEILRDDVLSAVPVAERDAVDAKVRFLNTVVGKMSGVVTGQDEIEERDLERVVPSCDRAFLVEAFNRILITAIDFQGESFSRGIAVFEEKEDLLPFEEAKLFGHNATHALAAYMGHLDGVTHISDLADSPKTMAFLRAAFMEESGEALIAKYEGVDPLFTREGYADYADDLLGRMTNPYLGDTVDRVARDPQRKLGWNDRLIGTMRLALSQGIQPRRYAYGVAAALFYMDPKMTETPEKTGHVLGRLWQDEATNAAERDELIDLLGACSTGMHTAGGNQVV